MIWWSADVNEKLMTNCFFLYRQWTVTFSCRLLVDPSFQTLSSIKASYSELYHNSKMFLFTQTLVFTLAFIFILRSCTPNVFSSEKFEHLPGKFYLKCSGSFAEELFRYCRQNFHHRNRLSLIAYLKQKAKFWCHES